jgi:hypothetical protein
MFTVATKLRLWKVVRALLPCTAITLGVLWHYRVGAVVGIGQNVASSYEVRVIRTETGCLTLVVMLGRFPTRGNWIPNLWQTYAADGWFGTPGGHCPEGIVVIAPTIPIILLCLGAYLGHRKCTRLKRRLLEFTCPKCNYDLRAHHPGDQCPECGTVIPATHSPPPHTPT